MKARHIFTIALFFSMAECASAQAVRLPTADEKTILLKNFQIILQDVPSDFFKIRKNDPVDFFGSLAYTSSVKLLPNEKGLMDQNILYFKDSEGKLIKAYTESLPFKLETCIDMLAPLLKQNLLTEVVPPRANNSAIMRSFKNSKTVVELSATDNNSITGISIGKLYYYYTADVKPITSSSKEIVAKTAANKVEQKNNGINVNSEGKKEEMVYKGLTMLYKSATKPNSSFSDLKTGEPQKVNMVDVFNVESKVQLDNIQSAKLFTNNSNDGINGVSIEISATNTQLYINALIKMAKVSETSGEIITEKKTGVTKYSFQSKSLKREIIKILDFEEVGYSDTIICNTIYPN